MTDSTQASWIALALIIVAALVAPYAVGAGRKRFTHPALPIRLYAPHLFFLCTVRFALMLSKALPPAGAIALAFIQAFLIWALGAAISEWLLRRRLHRGARDV